MREEVHKAREVQARRFAGTKIRNNSQMQSRRVRQYCELDKEGAELLKASVEELGLSARAHDKILRVARTIADLDSSDAILASHLSEAINYRILDRQLWT